MLHICCMESALGASALPHPGAKTHASGSEVLVRRASDRRPAFLRQSCSPDTTEAPYVARVRSFQVGA